VYPDLYHDQTEALIIQILLRTLDLRLFLFSDKDEASIQRQNLILVVLLLSYSEHAESLSDVTFNFLLLNSDGVESDSL